MELPPNGMEYSAIICLMNLYPAYDPNYIRQHPYRCILADEHKMGRNYRIIRESGLDDYLLMLTLNGGGIANKTRLAPFSIYLFKPGEKHDYGTDPEIGFWNFLWAHIHVPANWLPLLDWKILSINDFAKSERRRIVSIFRDAITNSSTDIGYDKALAMNLIESMLLRIHKACAMTSNLNFSDEVRTYILEHLSDALDIHTLAVHFRLSESRFAHRFKDTFGTSPQSYVENCRLRMAERFLLTTSKSIKEVAFACGFKDPLYFSKRFAKLTGKSPTEWKNMEPSRIQTGSERSRSTPDSFPCAKVAPEEKQFVAENFFAENFKLLPPDVAKAQRR